MTGYYEVVISEGSPFVYCDEWDCPPEDIWHSYVVYPYGERL